MKMLVSAESLWVITPNTQDKSTHYPAPAAEEGRELEKGEGHSGMDFAGSALAIIIIIISITIVIFILSRIFTDLHYQIFGNDCCI